MAWIIDNQLSRRNINPLTRNDLIGRRYSVEKNISAGRPTGSKEYPQNEDIKKMTSHKIANDLKIGHATVERAEKLSQAIDTITQNTGITRALLRKENQLKRRNVNSLTKTYLVGRRYLLEKKDWGGLEYKVSSAQNEHSIKTCDKIAGQLSVGQATVRRASEFTQAVSFNLLS